MKGKERGRYYFLFRKEILFYIVFLTLLYKFILINKLKYKNNIYTKKKDFQFYFIFFLVKKKLKHNKNI